MPKLRSLFGGIRGKPDEDKAVEKMASNRSPGVVARLMGLEMLPGDDKKSSLKKISNPSLNPVDPRAGKPVSDKKKRVPDSNTLVDITVSGKQLNGVTGSSTRRSKSLDGASGEDHHLLQVRGAAPHEAECLQSIQLEELNKQLMARHLQVLDQLNEARQQLNLGNHRGLLKGLSDSTEFLDAVELLQANRKFFEKHFQGSGSLSVRRDDESRSKMRVSKRIPQYLSGHSSPRPPPLRLIQESSELDRGTSIVVLKPRKAQKPQKELSKAPEKIGAPDIAKLIAKKIKESITKEVAKTFYSKLDSAVSPQKGSAGDSEARRKTGSSEKIGRRKSPELNETSTRKKAELNSPGSKRGASARQQQLKSSSAAEALEDAFKLDCSKNARVVKSHQKTSSAAAEKKMNESKSRALNKSRVLEAPPRRRPEAPVSPKVSRAGKNAGDFPKPVESLKESANNLDGDIEVDHSAADVPVDTRTPSKTEKNPNVIDLSENNKSSPVSVLELIDEDEDGFDDLLIVKTIDVIPSSECSQTREEPAEHEQRRVEQQDEIELVSSSETEEDLIYLRRLVRASSRGGMFNEFLEPSLFEALEEEYNQQSSEEMFVEPVRAQLRAIRRWLMFDLVSELVTREWSRGVMMNRVTRSSEQQALKHLWSRISDHFLLQKRGESQSMQSLARFDLNSDEAWDNKSGVPEICQQLENYLVNNLIDEAMADFLYC